MKFRGCDPNTAGFFSMSHYNLDREIDRQTDIQIGRYLIESNLFHDTCVCFYVII